MEHEDFSLRPLIDAQIDELVQDLHRRQQTHQHLADAPELRMVQDIRRAYQAEANEDERSLERVLSRLVTGEPVQFASSTPFLQGYQGQEKQLHALDTQKSILNMTSTIQDMSNASPRGAIQRRWKHPMNLLAATLFIALLMGSFLTVLNVAHSGTGPTLLRTTATPKLVTGTTTPSLATRMATPRLITGPVGTIVYKGDIAGDNAPGQWAWSPHGNRVAGSRGSMAATWDAFTGNNVITYQMVFPRSFVDGGSWSPDGSKIAFLNESSITVFDAQTAAPLQSLQTQKDDNSSFSSPTWSPNGKSLAVLMTTCTGLGMSMTCDSQIYVWDLVSDQIVVKRDMGGAASPNLQWSPNGQYLATLNMRLSTTELQLWNTLSWQVAKSYNNVLMFSWSPDGQEMAVVRASQTQPPFDKPDYVQIIDIASGQVLNILAQNFIPRIFWQPSGSRLAVLAASTLVSQDFHISLWDTRTGAQLYTFTAYAVSDMLWSSDGKYIECFPWPPSINPKDPKAPAAPNVPGTVIWIAD